MIHGILWDLIEVYLISQIIVVVLSGSALFQRYFIRLCNSLWHPLCEVKDRNKMVKSEFLSQKTRDDVFFAVNPKKLLKKLTSFLWFWVPWRSCDVTVKALFPFLSMNCNISVASRDVIFSAMSVTMDIAGCIVFTSGTFGRYGQFRHVLFWANFGNTVKNSPVICW